MSTAVQKKIGEQVRAQPSNAFAVSEAERARLIVSTITVGKKLQVLSTYGDDVWEFLTAPTNTPNCMRRIDFGSIPVAYRATMKGMTFRYVQRGLTRNSRRPRMSTIRGFFWQAGNFLKFLEASGVACLSDVTAFTCSQYVQRTAEQLTQRGKPPTIGHKDKRLRAVEMIHELSQFTDDPMRTHPWPESSAHRLSGKRKSDRASTGVTPIIPDDVFCQLFNAAYEVVKDGERILDLTDALDRDFALEPDLSPHAVVAAKNRFLVGRGWDNGVAAYRQAYSDLRTACYIVIASLSGCRNHEIEFLHTGAFYSSVDGDGDTYWWMKSTSTKTDAGDTEWMVPYPVVEALSVMDRWAAPYQASLRQEIEARKATNAVDPEIVRAEKHIGALFVGRDQRAGGAVRTISLRSMSIALAGFTRRCGIDWKVATHQFRRTFAYYVARSRLGDLRYLKEHFKHWSMDMTLLYALNESLDEELFKDIEDELFIIKEKKIEAWLDHEASLAGGAGRGFVEYRGSNPIVMFKSRAQMVQTIAQSVELRSTGHSWCSAHQAVDCVGNSGLDRLRCSDCDHSIIEAMHARKWQGLYDHLRSLLDCPDIGEAALGRIKRDIERCRKVLQDLGHAITTEVGAATA